MVQFQFKCFSLLELYSAICQLLNVFPNNFDQAFAVIQMLLLQYSSFELTYSTESNELQSGFCWLKN